MDAIAAAMINQGEHHAVFDRRRSLLVPKKVSTSLDAASPGLFGDERGEEIG